MCTKSQLGCIVLYCRLRFGLDITIFFNLKFKPDNIIWSHHLGIVSPELQADVDVLKDMLMFGEKSRTQSLTHAHTQSLTQFT